MVGTIGRRRKIHARLDCMEINFAAKLEKGLNNQVLLSNFIRRSILIITQKLDIGRGSQLFRTALVFMARQSIQKQPRFHQSLAPMVRCQVISPEKAF